MAPSAVIVGGPQQNILRVGTTVPLRVVEPLTTKGKKLKVGHRFRLQVSEAVMLNDQVVIPSGSPAMGEVTDIRNKGMWGKSGKINARILYVTVNGRQIRLSGQIDDKGVTGTAGVVAAVALIPVAGFFTTGTSAEIPIDTPVTAFLDEDVSVAFVEPTVNPLIVPASTPATPAN